MTIRFVSHNVADKPSALTEALQHGDYLALNECRDNVKAAVRRLVKLPNMRAWLPARQNVHVWRWSEVHVVERGARVLLRGGRRGLGGRRDKRRRGPTRDATWQLVYDVDTLGLLIIVDWHNIARSRTSERWRVPLDKAARVRLRVLLVWLMTRYPAVPIVVAGDGNLPKLGSWRLGPRFHAVRTPPDHGPRHYQQVYLRGLVQASDVREVHTTSDHDALAMNLDVLPGAPTWGPTA